MPSPGIDYREADQQIWEDELADFLPSQIFDAHAHLFDRSHLPAQHRAESFWTDVTLQTHQAWAQALYPGRQVHYLILGTPAVGVDVNAHNRFVADQVRRDPFSRANRLVTPSCSVADIERDVKALGFIGLKPYRLYAVTGDAAQCRIHEFFPHEQLELANELGLWVTMHLSRHHGCADEHNLRDLEAYTTRRYPRIRWILAHCARSFTYWPIRQAVDRLRQLPNIWYDLSAVTDIRPIITLFQQENLKRIFYGSDGVDATFFHGKYAALGRAWATLQADKHAFDFSHCSDRPILCVYEGLLAIKQAAQIVGLSRDQVEDLFWRNACRDILGIDASTGAALEASSPQA